MADRVWWMPPNGALHGVTIDRLMWWNLVALTALFLLAHVFLFGAMVRRRKAATEDAGLSFKWELIPLAGITLIYAWMAISAQRLWGTIRYQGDAPQALQVEVTGEQFQWYFRYPGDAVFGLTRPELINAPAGNPLGLDRADSHSSDDVVSSVLVLPAGREVDLGIRSIDVIHGFFIPGMRLKQNAVPGMEMHVHFTPAVVGDYPILCSQVCGSGHARMQAHLRVVPESEFQAWLASHTPRHGDGAR